MATPPDDALILPLANRRATKRLAKGLAKHLRVGHFVYLEGDLGAGKTFLVRAILRALGVPHAQPVTSPTFSLIHLYDQLTPPILHADLYRLAHSQDLEELGLVESSSSHAMLLEWSARFADALSSHRGLHIMLSVNPRTARCWAQDQEHQQLLVSVVTAL